ncbi:MAG: hypothetical protein HC860_26610, partial [Alkalinema sp. RU_4_3]|nr:hypothetical protein [Alkalinema sp. RU_4_3]
MRTNGLVRITESFDFRYQDPSPNFTTSPTSILTGSFGSGNPNLNGQGFPGNIRITSGGQTFVEAYAPGTITRDSGFGSPISVEPYVPVGTLNATASGSAGFILRADGSNASLVPSFRDRIFLNNTGRPEPPTPPEPPT